MRRRINGRLGVQPGQGIEVLADLAVQRLLFLDQFPARIATLGQRCLDLADIGRDFGDRVVQISHVGSLSITIR